MPGAYTPPVFAPNVNAIVAGARPIIRVGPWVTAGGSTTLTDIGHKSKIVFDWKRTTKDIEPEDVLGAVGDYFTKQEIDIKGTIFQLDPNIMYLLNSDPSSLVAPVTRVAGTTDGELRYGLDDPTPGNLIQFVMDIPVNVTIATVSYSYLRLQLWRCRAQFTKGPGFGKNEESTLDFQAKAFYDSSVVASTPYQHYGLFDYIAPA